MLPFAIKIIISIYIFEVKMKKCQISGCDQKAEGCENSDKIFNGMACSYEFWHCGRHTNEEIESHLHQSSMSMQMENPLIKAKSVIKKRSCEDK